MEYGIILEGGSSELVYRMSEALAELGLIKEPNSVLTDELLEALNIYRETNRLLPLDFCDPVTLRALGIEAGGDELMSLARCVEAACKNELEYYDLACEIVSESQALGITVNEAINRRGLLGLGGTVSPSAVTAAVLAFIGK